MPTLPLIIIVLLGLILFASLFTVKQQTAAILERFGKFNIIRPSGLHLKIPIIDKVAGRLSLKIQQLDVIIETKTLDDVFVKLKVSVQYKVLADKVYDAFYKLDYPHDQITSYVFVRLSRINKTLRVLITKTPLIWFFYYILFGFISGFWSVDFNLTLYRAFENLSFLLLICASLSIVYNKYKSPSTAAKYEKLCRKIYKKYG